MKILNRGDTTHNLFRLVLIYLYSLIGSITYPKWNVHGSVYNIFAQFYDSYILIFLMQT
jgi:hypothetical protein